tara:strand:- start:168 stop:494 length:327 start_codon:yes stop_codon:yes gene_type:complete
MFGFIQNLGAMEIFLILLIVLLLFGAKRLPELSRSMGKSLREFKKATSDVEEDFKNAMNEEPAEKKPKKETPNLVVPTPRSEVSPTSEPVPVVQSNPDEESSDSEKKA